MSDFEKELSLSIHKKYIPVLISPKLLRSYGCGQIDISYIDGDELTLLEAKNSQMGLDCMVYNQYSRLQNSAIFLESLLNIPVKMKFIAKKTTRRYPLSI